MPGTETLSIALPPEMVAQLRRAVESGEYSSSSEVVREALHDWNQKREPQRSSLATLRDLWNEARVDTSSGLDPDQVFDELEGKYSAIAHRADIAP